MKMEQPVRPSVVISIAMQELAGKIDEYLKDKAGERVPFLLILNADNVAQYISNMDRQDGINLIESLLERWKAGRADIPAHFNPDLAILAKPKAATRCPRCDSAYPHLHPAVQSGGEVQVCTHPFHNAKPTGGE